MWVTFYGHLTKFQDNGHQKIVVIFIWYPCQSVFHHFHKPRYSHPNCLLTLFLLHLRPARKNIVVDWSFLVVGRTSAMSTVDTAPAPHIPDKSAGRTTPAPAPHIPDKSAGQCYSETNYRITYIISDLQIFLSLWSIA